MKSISQNFDLNILRNDSLSSESAKHLESYHNAHPDMSREVKVRIIHKTLDPETGLLLTTRNTLETLIIHGIP